MVRRLPPAMFGMKPNSARMRRSARSRVVASRVLSAASRTCGSVLSMSLCRIWGGTIQLTEHRAFMLTSRARLDAAGRCERRTSRPFTNAASERVEHPDWTVLRWLRPEMGALIYVPARRPNQVHSDRGVPFPQLAYVAATYGPAFTERE